MRKTNVIDKNNLNGGTQIIYKFDNGYGASVIRSEFSYGGKEGLWELAVIKFYSEIGWNLEYSTQITNDVLGHLTVEEVNKILDRIEKLHEVKKMISLKEVEITMYIRNWYLTDYEVVETDNLKVDFVSDSFTRLEEWLDSKMKDLKGDVFFDDDPLQTRAFKVPAINIDGIWYVND